jgi:hypothetical protein
MAPATGCDLLEPWWRARIGFLEFLELPVKRQNPLTMKIRYNGRPCS